MSTLPDRQKYNHKLQHKKNISKSVVKILNILTWCGLFTESHISWQLLLSRNRYMDDIYRKKIICVWALYYQDKFMYRYRVGNLRLNCKLILELVTVGNSVFKRCGNSHWLTLFFLDLVSMRMCFPNFYENTSDIFCFYNLLL